MYILTITTIFTALATLTVILRLFTRFYLIKSPGFDDVLVVGATVCTVNLRGLSRGLQMKFGSHELIVNSNNSLTCTDHKYRILRTGASR